MSGWTMALSLVWFPSLLAPCLSAQPRFHIFTQPQTLPAVLRCTCGAIFFLPEIQNPWQWPYHLVVVDGPCACPRLNKDFSPIADPGVTSVDNPVIMTKGGSLANEPMAFFRNAAISL